MTPDAQFYRAYCSENTREGIAKTHEMTDLSPAEIKQLTPIDLSDVSPTNITTTSLLQGTITIKWPYSSSSQKLTFLLANPDPRKRASGGQLKITLLGPAAEFLDKKQSGEQISIAPNPQSSSINIEKEESSARVKWHITFPKGCVLIVLPRNLPKDD